MSCYPCAPCYYPRPYGICNPCQPCERPCEKPCETIFNVISSTSQSLNTATIASGATSTAVIASFSVDADTTSKFNTTTNEYTVPYSGFYQLEAVINYENALDTVVTEHPRITIQILRNGSAISTAYAIGALGGDSTSIKNSVSLSIVKYLNKNDLLKVSGTITNVAGSGTIPADAFRLIERSFSGYKK
jgi:hypothetical protein